MEKEYNELSQPNKEKFTRICNKLLGNCFLIKKKEETKEDYYFAQTHRELFKEYFKLAGFEVNINETYGVVHLNNIYGTNRYNFKLIESIFLIIIRLLYHEKIQELSLSEQVFVTTGDIHDKFASLKIRDRIIDKTTLRNSLKLFKRFNIIDIIDKELSEDSCRIIIYPSILTAVSGDDIKAVYQKLESYNKGGENDEETDENQID